MGQELLRVGQELPATKVAPGSDHRSTTIVSGDVSLPPADLVTARTLLYMQRFAGNEAVSRLLAIHRATPARSVCTTGDKLEHDRPSSRVLSQVDTARPNPSLGWRLASPSRGRRSPWAADGVLQRLTTKAVNGVTIKVTSFTPQLSSAEDMKDIMGLLVDTRSPIITVSGMRFAVDARVTVAGGDIHALQDWKLGFIQTVLESSRLGLYESGARISIGIPTPIRDGLESGIRPWYSGGSVVSLSTSGEVSTGLRDRAGFDVPKEDPFGQEGRLKGTDGRETFGTWLILWHRTSPLSPVYLQYVPWSIDFKADCDRWFQFEVKGAGTRAGTTTDGQGSDVPVLTGPVPIALSPTIVRKTTRVARERSVPGRVPAEKAQ
jgi:hypothetical protein